MPTIAYVGLDVSQADARVCFLLADGKEPHPRWTIPNSQPGADALSDQLARLCHLHQIEQLRIGVEATGLLWWHLAAALKDAALLAALAPQIYALNPQLVHTFRANFGALPKSDHADAFLIAERIRYGRHLPAPFQLDARYAPLQRLTRFRCHLVQNLVREKSYFLSFLFLTFSSFGQVEPFGDPFGATSCAVLEEFTTDELAQRSLDDLATYLQERGRGRFADPVALATTLQRAARDSYRLDKVLAEPLRLVLGTTMATIRSLQHQLQALDKTIAQELAPIEQTLASVPGLGPVWTAGLIAELGDITRFDDDGAIAQYAGLTWETYQSGGFQADDTAMTKRGNSYLRYYLVEAANSVRIHCPEYAQYYASKVAETTRHAHKRALVLTARKLVRLIDVLLREGRIYQTPEQRGQRPDHMAPHTARPGPQRRSKRAPAVG
ncbi:MAG: IS110 family transposase [Roseiflexaceae bacterium]